MRVWMRAVGDELARCELTFQERAPIDVERARQEQSALAELLGRLGCSVELLPPLPGHPDACFVEDTALVLGQVAVLARPGAASRRGEVESIAAVLGAEHELLHLPDHATLEGGDVLRVDDVLYVGQSTRTNHPGLKALAHLVLGEGLRVKAVEVRGCLHLETGATWLGDGRVLARPDWLHLGRLEGLEVVCADSREPAGANVLCVGGELVASRAAPRTAEALRRLGYRVHEVALDELHRAEAGVTCLVLADRAALAAGR